MAEDKYSVDVTKLLRMSVVDRNTLFRTPGFREEIMSALTPTDLARAFPNEFKMGTYSSAGGGGGGGGGGGLDKMLSGGGQYSGSSTEEATASPTTSDETQAAPSKPAIGTKYVPSAVKRFLELNEKQSTSTTSQQKQSTTAPSKGRRIDRSQFAKELEDPETMRMFAGRMKTEVGSQGREAQIAWAETTFNRAAARGMTLKQAVSGAYFPTKNPGYSDNQAFHDVIREVYKTGSNTTDGATGNASLRVGFGYGKAQRQPDGSMVAPGQTAAFGGERFGREKADENWQPNYMEEIPPDVAEIPAEATDVQQQDASKSGAIYPETDAQGRPTLGPSTEDATQQNVNKLPQGLPQSFIDDFKGLSQQDQEKVLKKIEVTGPEKSVELINQFQNEYMQAQPQATPEQAAKATIEAARTNPSAEILKAPTSALENRVNELQLQIAGTRKGPLKSDLKRQLNYAADKTGLRVDVVSGGQRMKEAPGAKGSHRHDKGGAADLKLYELDKDGKKRYLNMNNPDDAARMKDFMKYSVQAGATGVGAGQGYMGPETMHIGGGNFEGDKDAHWGGAGWVPQALEEGKKLREGFDLAAWEEERAKQEQERLQLAQQQVIQQPSGSIYPETDAQGKPVLGPEITSAIPVQETQPVERMPTVEDPFLGIQFPKGMPKPNLDKLDPEYKAWAAAQDRAELQDRITKGWEKSWFKKRANPDNVANNMNEKFRKGRESLSPEELQQRIEDVQNKLKQNAEHNQKLQDQLDAQKQVQPTQEITAPTDVTAPSETAAPVQEEPTQTAPEIKPTAEPELEVMKVKENVQPDFKQSVPEAPAGKEELPAPAILPMAKHGRTDYSKDDMKVVGPDGKSKVLVTKAETEVPGAIDKSPTGEITINPVDPPGEIRKVREPMDVSQEKQKAESIPQQQRDYSPGEITRNSLMNNDPDPTRGRNSGMGSRQQPWSEMEQYGSSISTNRSFETTSFNQTTSRRNGSRFGGSQLTGVRPSSRG